MKSKGFFLRLLSCLGVCCLLLGCGLPALAKRDTYQYTVRVFSGQQGKINGQDMIEQKVPAGGRVNLYTSAVSLQDDSKYYVKGFRESGKGTEEILGVGSRLSSFVVTKDVDYVVAYGLRGSMVEYTVHYQDGNGNTLAPSETYLGNVGDRPVVAHLYIEGYQPQSYNLTKTLVEDPMENVFTFVYTRITTPTNQGGGTTTIINGGGATVVTPTTPTTPTTPEGSPEPDGEEEPEESSEPEEAEPTQEPEGIEEEDTPQAAPEEPSELVDLDDNEVPLANPNATPAATSMELKSEGKIFSFWAKLLVGLLVLLLVGTGLWFLFFFRRKKEKERSLDITEITDINVIKELMDDDKKL